MGKAIRTDRSLIIVVLVAECVHANTGPEDAAELDFACLYYGVTTFHTAQHDQEHVQEVDALRVRCWTVRRFQDAVATRIQGGQDSESVGDERTNVNLLELSRI
jgi:hypothetical protein